MAKEEKQGQMLQVLFSRMPNALAILALKQFKRLEKFNEKRIKIAKFYEKALRSLKVQLPKIKKDCRHIFLRYTIKTKKAEEITQFAKKHNIFLGDWYRPVIAPKGSDPKKVFYQLGSCPKAEKTSALSVNLPTHPRMTLEDVKRVVRTIKEFSSIS